MVDLTHTHKEERRDAKLIGEAGCEVAVLNKIMIRTWFSDL
jgi:hypothetical protein